MTTALAPRNEGQLERYIAEVAQYPLLSREEEQELARAFREENDIAAAHKLVVSNLRFVVKVAYKYKGYGLKLLDLIQEGNIGLMHAVKKFDPSKGYRLISYAVWWIRDRIHSFIMKNWSLVKLGSGKARRRLFFKLRSAKSRVEQDGAGGADARLAIASQLGVTEDEVTEMDVRMAGRDFSLDAPLTADSEVSHIDTLSDNVADQEQLAVQQQEHLQLKGAIQNAADQLDEKERYILEHRLLSEEPLTLAEIGKVFGFSRERARQLESRVIKKLREALGSLRALPEPA